MNSSVSTNTHHTAVACYNYVFLQSNDTLSLFSNPDALEKLIQYSFVSCTVHTVESLENVSNLTSLMGSTLSITNSVSNEHKDY